MEQGTGVASKSKQPETTYLDAAQHSLGRPTIWEATAKVLLMVIFGFSMCVVFMAPSAPKIQGSSTEPPEKRESRPRSFYDADGSTAYEYDIIPDIIHVIRCNQTELSFMDVVFLRSMYLNHRPSIFMVHCSRCGFTGPFVKWTAGINFTFMPTVCPDEIFGREINVVHHSTDIVRMRVLMEYGGIYLDRDVFVVNPLRRFFRYETTISCPEGYSIGNMIMIIHKNSRFLKLYYETYRQFDDSKWYYNAGDLPTSLLVEPHPHLLNRMYQRVEIDINLIDWMFEPHAFPGWRDAYAVHTYISHRYESPHDPLKNGPFNETNIRELDNAMGEMARSVLFGTSDFVGPYMPVASVAALAARKDGGEDLTKKRPGNAKPFFA